MGDVVKAVTAPVRGLFSGDPMKTAQALFAPSTLVSQQPGIVGQLSRMADSAVAGYFGGPLGAAGASAIDTGLNGGNLTQALTSGAEAGALDYAGAQLASGFGGAPAAGTASTAAPAAAGAGGSLADFSNIASQFSGGVGAGTGADALAQAGTALPTAAVSDAAAPAILAASSPSELSAALGATPGAVPASAAIPSLSSAGNAALGNAAAASPPVSSPGFTITSSAPTVDTSGTGVLDKLLGNTGTATLTSGAPTADTGLLSTIQAFTKAHPLLTTGAGLAAGQVLSPILSNLQGPTSQEKALLANAQGVINAQNSLIGSEASGVLPPGAEADIQNALNADKASIRTRYAQLGMTGSSAEAQDLANADNQAAAQRFQFAQQATHTGAQLAGISNQVYETLLKDQLNRQQQLSNSFSQFMSSIGAAQALGSSLNRAP